MNIAEVREFLKENSDSNKVRELLSEFTQANFGLEDIKAKAEEDAEVRAYFDSIKDSHHHKALETWKSNNLEKIVEEEIKKKFPEADERDLAIRELEDKINKMEREKEMEVLRNLATKEAVNRGLPVDLVDFFIAGSEEETTSNIELLESVFKKNLETMVEERFKDNSYIPPKGEQSAEYTAEDLAEMTEDEINRYFDSKLEK